MVLDELHNIFGGIIIDEFRKNDRRVYITVSPDSVPRVCRFLYENAGGRLAIATGTDSRGGFDVLYHFMLPKEHLLLTVKASVAKISPSMESIATFLPAANWIEREMYDLLGIEFTGHPDMRRILMSDDWPKDVFPLRRDFKGLEL